MAADVQMPATPLEVDACPQVNLPAIPVDHVPWPWGMTVELQAWALGQLQYPLGTIIRDTVGGRPVVARIECHDRYGADPSRTPEWHKGTSCYAPAVRIAGKLQAMTTPPAGWPAT